MSIQLTQVRTELEAFLRENQKEVVAWFYATSQLGQYAKRVAKIKGRYPALHSVTGHVVQGFESTWNAMGDTKFKVNELRDYHIKVNFGFKPSDVENSWIAELYDRKKKAADMPISRYIAEKELQPNVMEDMAILECQGVYDANDLGTFGKSLNGVQKMLTDGLVNADNPIYRIPLDTLTDSNMVEQVTIFERAMPKKVKSKVKRIYMSAANLERYIIDYENTFGTMVTYREDLKVRTRLNRWEIIGLDYFNSDKIWTTIDGNLLELVDYEDAPGMTDVQIADYDVKILMEGWKGWGFYTNQLVFCSSEAGSGSGLNATDNNLYYATA